MTDDNVSEPTAETESTEAEPAATASAESAAESAETAAAAETTAPATPVAEESGAAEAAPAAAAEEAESAGETAAETAAAALTLGEGTAAEEEEPRLAPVIRGKIDRFGVAMGTGRRKTAVARVRIRDGSGQLTINGRPLEEYFQIERDRQDVLAPLKATGTRDQVDVWVRVSGGGTTGQAGAIVLGIARALQARQPELHPVLSDGGYLTRDSRMVERKKYGYKKARRSFQFSKR